MVLYDNNWKVLGRSGHELSSKYITEKVKKDMVDTVSKILNILKVPTLRIDTYIHPVKGVYIGEFTKTGGSRRKLASSLKNTPNGYEFDKYLGYVLENTYGNLKDYVRSIINH